MYDTGGTRSVCQPAHVDYDLEARTRWLRSEIARVEARHLAARRVCEEEQALRLLNPLSTEEAFAWFGLFLGLFPPAAIFSRALWLARDESSFAIYVLFAAAMNVLCCLVGRAMAKRLAGAALKVERRAWWQMLLLPALVGALWGLVTGAASGALVLFVGALFGAACAVPVGALGFALFMTLHRLLARDGMIEERQLWPLAFGVPSVIAAAILGM